MTRAILVTLGWVAAAAALYVTLVSFELYWNLFDWQPRMDRNAFGLVFGVCAVLVAIRFLARAASDRMSLGVSLVLCLGLLVLAIYVLPSEPLTQGLFARKQPSPLWYRVGRLVVLALPGSLWARAVLSRRKAGLQPGSCTGRLASVLVSFRKVPTRRDDLHR
ncbi:MAG TPA: hypothetical protein VNZ64_22130 [Candidatus Acidoferrum sp.]|jgi:hypothetical protein|nr:hypothetical protein [Candidatus Acidoferrum sp.]